MATGARPQDAAQNVNDLERLLSVVAGGALAAYALKRRGASGLAAGVLGGFFVQRGVTGHCYAYDSLGLDSKEHRLPNVVQRHGPAAVPLRSYTHNRSATRATSGPPRIGRVFSGKLTSPFWNCGTLTYRLNPPPLPAGPSRQAVSEAYRLSSVRVREVPPTPSTRGE